MRSNELGPSFFELTNHDIYLVTASVAKNHEENEGVFSPSKEQTEDGKKSDSSYQVDKSGFIATWVLPISVLKGSPRFLIVVSPENYTYELIKTSNKLVLHMLSEGQEDLVVKFGAVSGAEVNKFNGLGFVDETPFGPRLNNAVGYIEAEVISSYDVGERVLVVCEAKNQSYDVNKRPLTKKYLFSNISEVDKAVLVQKKMELAKASQKLFESFP